MLKLGCIPSHDNVVSRLGVAAQTDSNFGKPLDCVLVVPADGGFPCGRRLRGDVVRAVVETGGVVGQHQVEVGDVDMRLVPVDQRDPICGHADVAQGWGRRGRRMSDVRRAAPTLLGIEQRPQAASRRGRSSSRSRRAGGRSTIASPGAAASPASTDAAGGACRPRDASRPPSRAVRPPRRSSPPDRPRTAGRPSSGSAPARSDLHGRGVGGARSPTRDQRRSWHRDDRPRGARGRARSTRRWRLRQRAVRCELRLHPTA